MVPRLQSKEDLKVGLPNTSEPVGLTGLDAPIEIYRDRYGIPHVKALSSHDAFLGQGFVTAQDRLWQMEVDRRRAYGRWAEYAGSGAVSQDVWMRRFQIEATVLADYDSVDAETKAMLDAYATGVNAFLETTSSLPVEYSLVKAHPEP